MELKKYLACAVGALSIAFTGTASAQSYPERTIKIVIPFAPGGPADLVGRDVARLLADELKQSVVVVNASGGHGVPAMNEVINAPADGYTLLMPASGYMTIPSAATAGKDITSLLTPISLLTQSPHVLVATSSLPASNMSELIDYARKNPGAINYGSAGVGGIAHMGMELLANSAKIEMTHIPYRGSSQAITDLAAGQTQLMLSSMPSLKPMIDKGAIKILGITSASKGADTKTIPLIAETVPGVTYRTWYALFAKAGTPKEIIDTLNSAVQKVIANPELQEKFEPQGIEFLASTPEELSELTAADTKKWAHVMKEANIEIK